MIITSTGGPAAELAYRLERVDALESPVWEALVGSRHSDVFHSPDWLGVLHDTYGFRPVGRVLLVGGEPRAGLVSCRIDDLRGAREVSLPFSDYCDPLVDDEVQWGLLADDVPADAPLRVRCLHNRVPLEDERFEPTSRAVWHGVDLTRPLDEIWESLRARTVIRRAERQGVRVRVTRDAADLRRFYEMHLATRRYKYGLLAQPYRFFQAIHDRFLSRGKGDLLLAEVDGEPIAGILLLYWRRRAYYKFNASRQEMQRYRANDLLMWHAIRHATEGGYELLDLGLSDEDQEGLVRYKDKYASSTGYITFVQRPPATSQTAATHAEAAALLPALTSLMTSAGVPDTVVERAGELLYRYFA